MPDSSRRPPSDGEPGDVLGVAGYLLDEALPDVTAARIAAELGAEAASRASRKRRTLVAGALVATAAAAATVIVAVWPARPRPELKPDPAATVAPAPVAAVPTPPPAPRPVPDWKRPGPPPREIARRTPEAPSPPTRGAPAKAMQPKDTRALTAPPPEGAAPAAATPAAPAIVTGAVVPAEPPKDVEQVMTMFAVRTDRPRGHPMFMRISYRPSPAGPAKETP